MDLWIHHSPCTLPRHGAALLATNPRLISSKHVLDSTSSYVVLSNNTKAPTLQIPPPSCGGKRGTGVHHSWVHVDPNCVQIISRAPKQSLDTAIVQHRDVERSCATTTIRPIFVCITNKCKLFYNSITPKVADFPGDLRQVLPSLEFNLHRTRNHGGLYSLRSITDIFTKK